MPKATLTPTPSLDNLAAEHRRWLSAFDGGYLKTWERHLSNNYETAMAEAAVRRLLERHGARIEPNESLTGEHRSPDFRCFVHDSKFYVEVTCISIEDATNATGITTNWNGGHYQPLTESVFRQSKKKAPQCGNLDAPAFVATGTFHYHVALHCFEPTRAANILSGTPYAVIPADLKTGQIIGPATSMTDCTDAAFLQPDQRRNGGLARNSISGLLLCGLSPDAPSVLGILHPNPVRPFNPVLLPNIPFGTVTEDEHHALHVHWPEGDRRGNSRRID